MLLVRSRIYILILLLAAATATRGYSQTFALHDGDRVVFYGDSITAQRLYTRFVEDMVREVALAFDADPRVLAYEIEVENHESIHDHNAYAYLKRERSE